MAGKKGKKISRIDTTIRVLRLTRDRLNNWKNARKLRNDDVALNILLDKFEKEDFEPPFRKAGGR